MGTHTKPKPMARYESKTWVHFVIVKPKTITRLSTLKLFSDQRKKKVTSFLKHINTSGKSFMLLWRLCCSYGVPLPASCNRRVVKRLYYFKQYSCFNMVHQYLIIITQGSKSFRKERLNISKSWASCWRRMETLR